MSASPVPAVAVPSQKRPLEEPSSEAGFNDQPEAKRPALELTLRDEAADSEDHDAAYVKEEDTVDGSSDPAAIITDAADGTVSMDDGSLNGAKTEDIKTEEFKTEDIETQPILSTTHANGSNSQNSFNNQHQDETNWLHMRSVISSAEAATVIGKGGENVTLIRRLSGAKCTVSDYARGAVERVLTVSGLVDAVAKAFGLIIRTLNNEGLEAPSTAQSKTYPLRLLIPHILIGSIIGQKGVRIREIQEASGARLNASESCLPLSTERSLVVLGVADAVHIATYYVGSTLVEQLTERFGGPAASAYATRSGGPAGAIPGGMQVVPYTPQPAGGQWGQPEHYKRHPTAAGQPSRSMPSHESYSSHHGYYGSPQPTQQPSNAQYGGAPARQPQGYPPATPQAQQAYPQQPPAAAHPAAPQPGMPAGGSPAAAGMAGQPLTQQIFIPNDMVGAIIGKGGAKINEIRQLSGSVIKINEPQDNSNERLVTITGTQACNQMALYMLYQRLEGRVREAGSGH